MMKRKIIFKCKTGSHLYGTNLPTSDDDYLGVFLPSREDLLGLNTAPKELQENVKVTTTDRNGLGDVDCKFLSLQHFFRLCLEGQPIAIELLYAPGTVTTPEWETIMENKEMLLSRKGIRPFLGFALSQANKSKLKGGNLLQIRNLIKELTPVNEKSLNTRTIEECIEGVSVTNDSVLIYGVEVKKTIADDKKTEVLEIAGRKFNMGVRLKMFLKALVYMESRYGDRADSAAEKGVDCKSLSHAYRLVSQAEEFLTTGLLTFPRPDADFLKEVRSGQYQTDFREEINEKIDYIKNVVEPVSPLRPKPDFSRVEELCVGMLAAHLGA